MLTLEQALNLLPEYKREYFKWKFDIYFLEESVRKKPTKKEFLYRVKRQSFLPFERWERTQEYKALVDIYLSSKAANDLIQVYENVSKAAKSGDSTAINQLIRLQKEIQDNAKQASKDLSDIIQKTKRSYEQVKKEEMAVDGKYDDDLIL